LFPNSLNLCSSLIARDKVSYPYKTTGKIVIFLYFNLYVLTKGTEIQKNLNWMLANNLRIWFSPNFFLNTILVCYCCSKIF
jgi:hypothetical protein